MNKQQQALQERLKQEEPIVLTPYERLRMEHRDWEGRANEALQRIHAIQKVTRDYGDHERNVIQFEDVHTKAQELAVLYIELELLEGIRKAAQARADRLWIDIQNSGQNVPPRVLQYRLLRSDLYQAGLRVQELSNIPFTSRQPDWNDVYAEANEKLSELSNQIAQYSDIEASEELNRKIRQGT